MYFCRRRFHDKPSGSEVEVGNCVGESSTSRSILRAQAQRNHRLQSIAMKLPREAIESEDLLDGNDSQARLMRKN